MNEGIEKKNEGMQERSRVLIDLIRDKKKERVRLLQEYEALNERIEKGESDDGTYADLIKIQTQLFETDTKTAVWAFVNDLNAKTEELFKMQREISKIADAVKDEFVEYAGLLIVKYPEKPAQ